jgi:hypothetical protein
MTTPFPLIVGSGRSGTTLLRNILDAHPDLAVAHEAHFLAPLARHRRAYGKAGGFDGEAFVTDLYLDPNFRRLGLGEVEARSALRSAFPADYAAAARAILAAYAASRGKSRFGDKTPGYVKHMALLADIFPEARFIHIIRDGRDVALAYLDRSEWGPTTVGEAALYWRSRVEKGREAGRLLGPRRYREILYEDLVDDPEGTVRDLCDFIELEYHPGMLAYHERGRDFVTSTATPEAFTGLTLPVTKGLRDWRSQMSPEDQWLFDVLAGNLLDTLGYERSSGSVSISTRVEAGLTRVSWLGRRVRAHTPGASHFRISGAPSGESR